MCHENNWYAIWFKLDSELDWKKFDKYKCDAFELTNSVTQIVGLYIGDEVYALTNVQEAVDYFGTADDMAVAKVSASEDTIWLIKFLIMMIFWKHGMKSIRRRIKEMLL